MKLIIMERTKGRDEEGKRDYFVQFEAREEYEVYNRALNAGKLGDEYPTHGEDERDYWHGVHDGMIAGMLSQGLGQHLSDDDIYYYFAPGETVPAVGEVWELDYMAWRRVQ